jgi:ABC-type glycerol-3-phosphate transport system substrate-binding protein
VRFCDGRTRVSRKIINHGGMALATLQRGWCRHCSGVALWLVLTLLLAGSVCSTAKTTLQVMDWKLHQTAATQAWFQQVKETFEEEHPGVEIEYVPAAYGTAYREKLLVGAAAGTAPDAVSLSIVWARELWDAGVLLNLNPFIEKTPELHPRNFIPATQVYNQVDGDVYGITNAMDEALLLYNCDFFEQSGLSTDPYAMQSWDDLKASLRKLVQADSSGTITRHGLSMGMGAQEFTAWLTANGGSFYLEPPIRSGFNSKEGLESAEFLVSLQQSRLLGGNFSQRSAAMGYGLNSTPYHLNRDAPDLNFLVTSFPKGPSGSHRGSTVWGNMYSITEGSSHPELAWEFIKYYGSLRGNIDIFNALDYVTSPRLDFYRSREWVTARMRQPWMPIIPEIASVGGVYPFLASTELTRQVWNPLARPALMGTLPIQSAFAQAAEIYDRLLREMSASK